MLDKFPIVLDEFKGIRVTDVDSNYVSRNVDIVPFDYAFEANNIHFLKSGGFKTRDGFATLLESSGISITGDIVQFWQIKNLNGIPRSNRWLILTWDGSDGRLYDTGVTAPATNPILLIASMKYAFVINAFNRMYISPWEAWGSPLRTTTTLIDGIATANMIFVYNGLYNARFAQSAQGAPSGGPVAAATGAAGNVTAGLHLIDVVFETDTGFLTDFHQGGSLVTQYTAPGAAAINLTNIPLGPTPYTVARRIVMTKIVLGTYDGQGFKTNEPFFSVRLGDNTTTVLTIDTPDSGLVDSAGYIYGRSINIKTCVSMSVYNNRMIYNGLRTTGASDPPPDPENNSAILVSPPGLPEDVNHFNADGSKVYIGQEYTGKVMNSAELRGVCYIGKEDSLFAIQEEVDKDPDEWKVTLIDSGIGIFPLGITNVTDNPGSLVLDNLLFAGPTGIHRFTGTFDPIPISIGIWDNFSATNLKYVQPWADPGRKLLFALFNDPASADRFLVVGNYYKGFSHDTIRWSKYTLPSPNGNWPGKVSFMSLYVDSSVQYPVPVIAYKGATTGYITVAKETPGTLRDLSINADIDWEHTTGFTPNELGKLLNFSYLRLRAITEDINYSISVYYSGIDDDDYIAIPAITPGNDPKKFYTMILNFIGEKIRFKITGKNKAVVNKLVLFASEIAQDRAR